jgi:hypothetical protein
MNLQVQQNMNNQTTSPIQNGVTKSPTASSGSHGAVAQLDDTRVGMGTFVALKGVCGKTTTTNKHARLFFFRKIFHPTRCY